MTVFDKVRFYIMQERPKRLCDACIAKSLGLIHQHANHKTLLLAQLAAFTRYRSICSLCGAARKVIWAK